jgi:AraC family transcriptional regulator of adaptative response / DNA-3-methyladenine glycosylase II
MRWSDSRQTTGAGCAIVGRVVIDSDRLWRAIEVGDARFDGWVFCGVCTTGIYCRPSCPARTPRRENVRLFATAAAAHRAGFRACKRCRPDVTPGSPEWDRRADMIGRAMRLIADGVVDREGVRGLSARLGYSERHVHRALVAAVGAGPLSLARANRAQAARVLLETTSEPVAAVAFAAGFGSVRQFNATIRQVFAAAPGDLRERARRGGASEETGAISLRLPYRAPLDAAGLFGFLARRAVPGVEEPTENGFRRSLRLPHAAGVVEVTPVADHVRASFRLDDLRDLAAAIQRVRALLDLDSDPVAVVEALGGDRLLAASVLRRPGLRVPGTVDGAELALRAVIGQQVSVAGAATVAGRLARALGEPLSRPLGAVTHLFPTAGAIAESDPAAAAMPRARARALCGLARALDRGQVALGPGADRAAAMPALLALPGVGRWTADYVAMRALRDPDAFLATDLGVRRALELLGVDGTPRGAAVISERWRPYRAYATLHLWGLLEAADAGDVRSRGRVRPSRARAAAA